MQRQMLVSLRLPACAPALAQPMLRHAEAQPRDLPTPSNTQRLTSEEALDLAPSAQTSIVFEEQRRFVAEASANCSGLVCSIVKCSKSFSCALLADSEVEKREARPERKRGRGLARKSEREVSGRERERASREREREEKKK